MIKHILKIIWNQRRSNGWIFAELLVVVSILWVMTDSLLVDKYTYYSPLGFDIEDTYKVQLGILAPGTPGYVDDSLLTTRQGEDVLRLAGLLRQAPEVEEVSISHVGCVYTENRSWSQLYRADADTFIKANFRQSTVSPEYFTVLRMKDTEGNLLGPQIGQRTGGVITSDLERVFYGADVSVPIIPKKTLMSMKLTRADFFFMVSSDFFSISVRISPRGTTLDFDMLDTIRLPYTWWRFAVTFGGAYLLMAGMISLGIWFPMYKAVRMKPAEALHYE